MLRGIVAGESFRREEADMRSRRQKEEELAKHFREIYEKTSVSSGENHSSAGGESVQILRLTKRNSRRHSTPPSPTADRGSHADASTKSDSSWSMTSLENLPAPQPSGAVDDSAGGSDDAMNSRSFGKDVLSLHRTFVTVNNKVTVNLSKPRASLPQIDGMHGGDGSVAVPVEASPHSQQSLRMAQKLELLSQEDQRVQSALRHRERLMRRNEMASLFENSGEYDITD